MLRQAAWTLVLVVVLSPLILLGLAIERQPLVRDSGPPDARAAERTRAVVERLRLVTNSADAVVEFSADQDEINGVLAAAQHLAKGVAGEAQVEAGGVKVALSVGAPLMPRGLWVNLEGELAASEDGVEIVAAKVGRVPVPPALVLMAARHGLDRLLGDELGSEALARVARVEVTPPRVSVTLAGDPASRTAFFDRLKARVLGEAGDGVRVAVDRQIRAMRRASRRGELPRQGSVLPYLEAVVRFAGRRQGAGPDEMRGALYALALACGDPAFGEAIGILPGLQVLETAGCGGTTLAGRDDLKRHFVISAGLYAATTSGAVAFGVGELKELLDSSGGGEGFSFDDMAADAAGVNFAAAFLAAEPSAWPGMLAAIGGENDVMPALEGLPEGMDDVAFRARFRDVDSDDYDSVVAEIERRVDALPLYVLPTD